MIRKRKDTRPQQKGRNKRKTHNSTHNKKRNNTRGRQQVHSTRIIVVPWHRLRGSKKQNKKNKKQKQNMGS